MGFDADGDRTGRAARARRVLAVLLTLGLLAGAVRPAFAEAPPDAAAPQAAGPAEESDFVWQILSNLLNSRALMDVLSKPQYTIAAFIALNVIVFTETGLLVGFFLPGDSLLVTAGLICANPTCGWSLPLLLVTLCAAAVVGDSVGYTIGYKTGPKIFCREQSFFFKKDHLLKAQHFYERHGGKTIVLARFIPILRTFAPVVAGVGRMEYRSFLFFNVFGGVGWVSSMLLIGYFLPRALNPVLAPLLGDGFQVQDHVEKVIIVVVLLSISPGFVVWLRSKLKGRGPAEPALAGPNATRMHTDSAQ
jgi:membrane-associated protein